MENGLRFRHETHSHRARPMKRKACIETSVISCPTERPSPDLVTAACPCPVPSARVVVGEDGIGFCDTDVVVLDRAVLLGHLVERPAPGGVLADVETFVAMARFPGEGGVARATAALTAGPSPPRVSARRRPAARDDRPGLPARSAPLRETGRSRQRSGRGSCFRRSACGSPGGHSRVW